MVVDEGATSSVPLYPALDIRGAAHLADLDRAAPSARGCRARRGAAIACPDRQVVAFQADGSGLYTLQALWTQARESLDVTTIICANRAYRILQIELMRAGVAEPGRAARSLTDLGEPTARLGAAWRREWVFPPPAQRTRTPWCASWSARSPSPARI